MLVLGDSTMAATVIIRSCSNQFDKDGKVAIDKRLGHKGRYKIVEQAPRDQLVIEMDSNDIGTYRFLIIEVNDKELVLEPSLGTFRVYRRP